MKTNLYIIFMATMMVGCNNSEATKGFNSVDASRFAEVIENEQVHIYNITTGERFSTYVIKGEAGTGVIGINGAAAHKAYIRIHLYIQSNRKVLFCLLFRTICYRPYWQVAMHALTFLP